MILSFGGRTLHGGLGVLPGTLDILTYCYGFGYVSMYTCKNQPVSSTLKTCVLYYMYVHSNKKGTNNHFLKDLQPLILNIPFQKNDGYITS